MRSRWLNWTPDDSVIEKLPEGELTKPTKPLFWQFWQVPSRLKSKIGTALPLTRVEPDAISTSTDHTGAIEPAPIGRLSGRESPAAKEERARMGEQAGGPA